MLKPALVLAGLAFAAQLAPQQGPPKGAISGVVVDAITGQPIGGATVSLARIGPTPVPGVPRPPDSQPTIPRVVTDVRGRFVYAGLEPGDDYFLGARMPGYEFTRYGWTAPGQTLTIADILRIVVTPGGWVNDIKIPLWRLPSIGGRVVDERGEPIVGVAVRAFSNRMIAGQFQPVGSTVATTDDRGVYRLVGLSPGRYVVSVLSVQSTVLASTPESPAVRTIGELQTGGVSAGGPASISGPGLDLDGRHRLALTNFTTPPPPSSTVVRAYAQQFYPGVSTLADATQIDLAYRQDRLGVDFQLRPVPAVRVSGRVEGVLSAGMLLRLMPAGSEALGFGGEAATTVLDADGTFSFFQVPAGRYTLLAQASVMDFTSGSTSTRLPPPPGFPGGGAGVGSRNGAPGLSYLSHSGAAMPSWGRMQVNVGGSAVDNLILTMRPVGKMTGRIEFAEGTEVPAKAFIRVRAEPANGDPSLGLASATATVTNGVYSFVVEGLLGGSYGIDAGGGPYQLKSVTVSGRDVLHSGIDASTSSEINDIVITLHDKTQQIRGVVTAPPGRSAGVILFPADTAHWKNYGWDAKQFATTRAGSAGAFTLRANAAGEYYAIAVDTAKLDSWTDSRFLAAAAPLATRISIAWGETKTVDLTWRDVVIK